MELIEREGLLDIAEQQGHVTVDDILGADTIDAVPVVHGRWIDNQLNGYKWSFSCSECGWIDGFPFNERHSFCPNCGARMDGGEGHEA